MEAAAVDDTATGLNFCRPPSSTSLLLWNIGDVSSGGGRDVQASQQQFEAVEAAASLFTPRVAQIDLDKWTATNLIEAAPQKQR